MHKGQKSGTESSSTSEELQYCILVLFVRLYDGDLHGVGCGRWGSMSIDDPNNTTLVGSLVFKNKSAYK